MTTIDMSDPNNRRMYSLLQVKACLSIQAKTGMTHSRGSVIGLVNEMHGTKFRTAAKALPFIEEEIEKLKREIEETAATTLERDLPDSIVSGRDTG